MNKIVFGSLFFNFLLVIAVIFLFFKLNNIEKTDSIKSNTDLNIVFINTDTVWDKFLLVKDKKKELDDFESNLQQDYNSKMKAFEYEYKSYLKDGTSGKLSLNEQKRKEEELSKKQEALIEYDKQLSKLLIDKQQEINNLIQDEIISHLKTYNTKAKYNYILGYSRNSGILLADEKKEITKEIIKGLNEKYIKKN
ncbi:MAG: OmpH family outer membrane protein [Bacteroidales bacterium]|nr:OmpH family outer membrane protein [Bacteroidales bacterium]